MENKDSYLETSKAERSMWLMKCRGLVSRSLKTPRLSSFSSPSQVVAKVILSIGHRVSSDANDYSSTQFTMELVGTEAGDVPERFSMDMTKDFVPMSVFSESSQGKFSVEGKIINKFDMRPHDENIEKYGKLCRERTNKYMNRSRQIQVIDNDNGTHMRPMPGMLIAAVFNEKKKAPTSTSDTKRTRRGRGEMEDIMFKLFERQPNGTLRQLIQETDQAEQFLKDILKGLCIYNNRGTNQGSYELKPEYKKASNDTNLYNYYPFLQIQAKGQKDNLRTLDSQYIWLPKSKANDAFLVISPSSSILEFHLQLQNSSFYHEMTSLIIEDKM
ncbi:hypothetical protein DITRI_Ditri09bG0110900 [Diplodiscus trichospermus]